MYPVASTVAIAAATRCPPAGHSRAVRGVVHGRLDPGHPVELLLDPGGARRAGHAADLELDVGHDRTSRAIAAEASFSFASPVSPPSATACGHAVREVVVEQEQGHGLQGAGRGRDLGEDVDAVGVLVHHPLDAADLSLDPAEPALDVVAVAGVPGRGRRMCHARMIPPGGIDGQTPGPVAWSGQSVAAAAIAAARKPASSPGQSPDSPGRAKASDAPDLSGAPDPRVSDPRTRRTRPTRRTPGAVGLGIGPGLIPDGRLGADG